MRPQISPAKRRGVTLTERTWGIVEVFFPKKMATHLGGCHEFKSSVYSSLLQSTSPQVHQIEA